MKVTPQDIRHVEFKTAALGYNKQEVKLFLKDVQKQLEQLLFELRRKEDDVSQLEKMHEEHKHRESMLKATIVSTQRVSEEIKKNSQKEAEMVVEQAELQAERVLAQAHMRLKQIIMQIQDAKKQKVEIVVELRSMLESHQRMLAVLEGDESHKNIEDIGMLPKKY